MRTEWQKFLNLCICQETHLDNVEEFKRVKTPPSSCGRPRVWDTCNPFLLLFQYQIETELLSETLNKLNNTLEPKAGSQKSNSEKMLQLEVPFHPD